MHFGFIVADEKEKHAGGACQGKIHKLFILVVSDKKE
jgi:hypothetical protein